MAKSGYTCIRYVFCWLNLLLWFSGCAMLGLGIWLRISFEGYANLVPQYPFLSVDYFIIAAGSVAFLLAFLGCCGSWMQSRWMLISYFILVIVILLTEFTCGTLAFVFREKISHTLKEELKDGIQNHYSVNETGDNSLNRIWDHLQLEFRCCGVSSYEDWYLISAWPKERWVPDTCCLPAVRTENCGKSDADNWYEGGCYEQIRRWFISRLSILGIIGVLVAFIQLYGLISSMLLFCTIKHRRCSRKYKSYRS